MAPLIRIVTGFLALCMFTIGVMLLMLGLWGFIGGRYDAIGACLIGIVQAGTGGALFYAIKRGQRPAQ